MSGFLPSRPSLTYLKQQANNLFEAYRAGDKDARRLFTQYLPWLQNPASLRRVVYSHALFVVAREYGFSSWPKLKQHVETLIRTQVAHDMKQRLSLQQHKKQARQQRTQELAERLVVAAQAQNFDALFRALAIPARDSAPVRMYLVEQKLYTLIVDMLLIGAKHPQDRVRFLTAQALDHFADDRCTEPLQRLLHDSVPRVRWAAVHSLQCATCKIDPLVPTSDVVGVLINLALNDPSVKVRRVASYELGQVCTDARVIPVLKKLVEEATDATIVRNARRSLHQHSGA